MPLHHVGAVVQLPHAMVPQHMPPKDLVVQAVQTAWAVPMLEDQVESVPKR